MWLQPQLVVGVLALASTGAGYAPRLPHARPPLGGARFNPPRASTPMEQQQRQQQQRQQQQQQQQQALEPLVVDKQARQQQVADALQALLPSRSRVDEVSRRGGESDALRAQPLQGTTEAMAAAGDEAALRRHAELVEKSYEQCRLITKQYAATFYFGTKFFEIEKRRAVWAVYAWCRRTDDIVDKPRKDSSSLRDELDQWQARLEDLWRHRAHDLIDLALVDTIRNYPEMAIEPFEDMIKGMVMDLDQNRFKTFDELYVYCYRVAGTVGVMMMPIMGAHHASNTRAHHAPAAHPTHACANAYSCIVPAWHSARAYTLAYTQLYSSLYARRAPSQAPRRAPRSRRRSSPPSRSAWHCSSPTSCATWARTGRGRGSTCRRRTWRGSGWRRLTCCGASRTRSTWRSSSSRLLITDY